MTIVNYEFDKEVVAVTKVHPQPVRTDLRRAPMIAPASGKPWYGVYPTDNEEAPDNQYGIIRKDARPWNHCCLAAVNKKITRMGSASMKWEPYQ